MLTRRPANCSATASFSAVAEFPRALPGCICRKQDGGASRFECLSPGALTPPASPASEVLLSGGVGPKLSSRYAKDDSRVAKPENLTTEETMFDAELLMRKIAAAFEVGDLRPLMNAIHQDIV